MLAKHPDTKTFPATKRVQGDSLIVTIADKVLKQILPKDAPSPLEATAFIVGANAIATQVFGKEDGGDLSITVKMGDKSNLEGVKGCSVFFSGTQKPYTNESYLAEVCLNFEPT